MKFITFLLALLVLFGAIYPCCPTDNCQDEIINYAAEGSSDPDACSPFFACTSCPGFVNMIKPVNLDVPENLNSLRFEKLRSSIINEFYSSLFQPPRLA